MCKIYVQRPQSNSWWKKRPPILCLLKLLHPHCLISYIWYKLYIVYIIWCVPPSTWWWKEVHPPPPHAHYTWAASTPPTPSQCGPSRQSVTKSRRPGQLSGTSGPSPVFPTFPTPVIWATRGYWICFFCQENRSPPKLILTMKLKDSTAWYCDV